MGGSGGNREEIVAAVTLRPETVMAGGVPVFVAGSPEEREKMATAISRIMDVQAHDLGNGTYILVRH